MTDQEKNFISLQKFFFALQDKMEKYKMAGRRPPAYLLQKFEQTKRELHFFSKAYEKTSISWTPPSI
jgi:hypothetical protein